VLYRHGEYFVRQLLNLTSRPERIQAIASRFDLDADLALENISVARAYTVDHLNQLLMGAAGMMYQEEYALLIVDSIMAPFRVDYSGRGELCIHIYLIISGETASPWKDAFKTD
jgi:hypothetical protein